MQINVQIIPPSKSGVSFDWMNMSVRVYAYLYMSSVPYLDRVFIQIQTTDKISKYAGRERDVSWDPASPSLYLSIYSLYFCLLPISPLIIQPTRIPSGAQTDPVPNHESRRSSSSPHPRVI